MYPALHSQADKEPLPSPDVAFPGQLSHPMAPADSLYVPAGHAEHVRPPPLYPALHSHADELVLPAGAYALTSHVLQAPDPEATLYFPAAHATHHPPSGPVYPVLHLQIDAERLPSAN